MATLEQAIKEYGVAKLAEECGVSPQAAHKWLKKQIPAERVLEIERLVGVAREAIRPDIYPPKRKRA